jgi:hypothetical protein
MYGLTRKVGSNFKAVLVRKKERESEGDGEWGRWRVWEKELFWKKKKKRERERESSEGEGDFW